MDKKDETPLRNLGVVSPVSFWLGPDRRFISLTLVYVVGIGILTLSIPVAVQALLSTVINTALPHFVIVLAVILFLIILVSACLMMCRDYAIELYQRHIFVRSASTIALHLTHAEQQYMDSINRAELVNRFFEIMNVQKAMSILLVDALFVALQAIVGIVVVSFYHPFLLIFNLIFVAATALILFMWVGPASFQAEKLSDSKYTLVQWLEEIARLNPIFKANRTISYALEKVNGRIQNYLNIKMKYFRLTFSQHIAFLLLYCLLSAFLLGLGGVLVTKNQLSMGQLIGAELIMSAIFYSMPKFGYYLRVFYELLASLKKMDYLLGFPLEDFKGETTLPNGKTISVTLEKISLSYRGRDYFFDYHIKENGKALIKTKQALASKLFLDLVKRFRSPDKGRVLLGSHDVCDLDMHVMRDHILSLDSISVVEGSVMDFFELYVPDIAYSEMISSLQLVGLDSVVASLPAGVHTQLVPSGYPLQPEEVVRLKLAVLLAAKPKVLVITQIFDIVPHKVRYSIMKHICMQDNLTLVYYTNRKGWDIFDHYFFIEMDKTHRFDLFSDLITFEDNYSRENEIHG